MEGEAAAFTAENITSAATAVLPKDYGFAKEAEAKEIAFGESVAVNLQIGKIATLVINYKKYTGFFWTRVETVGTVTLTKVQTSSSKRAYFSTSEIKAAAPKGASVISIVGTNVNYGSKKTMNATCY